MEAEASKHYAFWQAPVAAFYNKSFYVDVAQNWTGCGAAYMFLLCLIALLVSAFPFAREIARWYGDQDLKAFMAQIPNVTLNEGQLSIDKPCPYQIVDKKTGTVVAEFRTDQSGDPKIDASGTNPPIIVTRDVLYMDNPGDQGPPNVLKFADSASTVSNLTFNGSDLLNLWQTVLIGVPATLFFVWVPIMFLGHVFQMLVYGGVASLIAGGGERLPYAAAMRLAAMAMTPVITLQIIFGLLTWAVPAGNFGLVPVFGTVMPIPVLVLNCLSVPMAIGYIIFATKALTATNGVAATEA